MRLETDGDTVTLETEREDRELAEAAGDPISGTVRLAESIGARECDWCDDRGRLRPYQVTIDGEFQVLDVCADCQADFVEEAAGAAEQNSDRLSVSSSSPDPDPDPDPPDASTGQPDHLLDADDLDAQARESIRDELDAAEERDD
jgi:hypothetical protein